MTKRAIVKRERIRYDAIISTKGRHTMIDDGTKAQTTEIFTEEEVQAQLNKNKRKAEKLLNDRDKMDRFLERLERKLAHIPVVGGMLSEIPTLIALVKAYLEKRYLDIPIGAIIAIVASLIYFLSPIDLMPDFLPAIGLVDDAAVIALAFKLVHDDVKEYKAWRQKSKQDEDDSRA